MSRIKWSDSDFEFGVDCLKKSLTILDAMDLATEVIENITFDKFRRSFHRRFGFNPKYYLGLNSKKELERYIEADSGYLILVEDKYEYVTEAVCQKILLHYAPNKNMGFLNQQPKPFLS